MVHTYQQQAGANENRSCTDRNRAHDSERVLSIAAICTALVMPVTLLLPCVKEFYPWDLTSLFTGGQARRYSIRGMLNLVQDPSGNVLLILSVILFALSALIMSIPLIRKSPCRRANLIPAKICAIFSVIFYFAFTVLFFYAAYREWPLLGAIFTISGAYAFQLHIALLTLLFYLSSHIKRREKSRFQGGEPNA